MSDKPEMPDIEIEESNEEGQEASSSGNRTIRYFIIFGMFVVISIALYLLYLNFSGSERELSGEQDYANPAEAAKGSSSLIDLVQSDNPTVGAEPGSDEVFLVEPNATASQNMGDDKLNEIADLVGQVDARLTAIENTQERIVGALVSHAKKLDSIINRNESFDEITRSHFRVSNQLRENVLDLSEQISQIDGSISSEFSRFPVFVWSVSSWGQLRVVTVSHLDSPRNTSDLTEGDNFHGWVLESVGSDTVIFRSGERLHEVEL